MDLSNAFNNDYSARKANDHVLNLYYGSNAGSTYISFDFLTRTMVTRNGSSDGGIFVTPFSQLDPEVVEAMREKLVELKGNPPELGKDKPSLPMPQRKLAP